METSTTTPPRHPVLVCVEIVEAAVKDVADVQPGFMTTTAKAEALLALTRLTDQIEAVRLRVVAAADDVAAEGACRSVADWLAPRTQAEVIVRALEALPAEVDPDLVEQAEARLVTDAEVFAPAALRRIGDKVLEVVAPSAYDEYEARQLERALRRAEAATRLSFRRRGDGATELTARIPDAAAGRLRTYLEAFTAPRQTHVEGSPSAGGEWTDRPPVPGSARSAFSVRRSAR